MEWYHFVIVIPIIILGAYFRNKLYENKRNFFNHNDSWKDKK